MKNFKDYLAESARSYDFVVKFAVEPSKEQITAIESWLKRYDLRELSTPTLVENNHMEFIDVPNKHVYDMRVVIGVPISQYILAQDLKSVANIPEKFLVVRSSNEPIQQYSTIDQWERAVNHDAEDSGDVPAARLSTEREYTDAEQPVVKDQLFGDEYNKKLLTYLAGVSDSRPSMEVDPPAPLFSWIQMEDIAPGEPHQDPSNFNAHIKGAPMPVASGNDEPPVSEEFLERTGAMSDNARPVVKFYKTADGKAKQVVKPVEKN